MKVRVCRADEVPPGDMRSFDLAGSPVLLAHVGGRFFAIGDTCSHQHASLSEGTLDPGECTVECPLHNAVFSLESGEALEFPAEEPVPSYPVSVEDGEVFIEVP